MTGARRFPYARVLIASAVAVALSATIGLAAPKQAQAASRARTITRTNVLSRAELWVKHGVWYSQSRYHMGYRQDCSGFVSWAWQVGRSYTTRTIYKVSHPIARRNAVPGDAVLYKHHVVVFAGWKHKTIGSFYAYEEPTWGKRARKRVMYVWGGTVIRRDGIKNNVMVAAKPKPVTTPVASGSTTGTVTSAAVK